MSHIEKLPIEIQLKIWTYAVKVAYTVIDEEFRKVNKESFRLLRRANKGRDYCVYMENMMKYELDPKKRKPPPYYSPTHRKCYSCGLAIPNSDPPWKKQCIDCYYGYEPEIDTRMYRFR